MRLVLVLHAHLPWVRDEVPFERWLHEALWACYLPLLDVFDTVRGITLSVSPTLAGMLADEALQRRFVHHLDAMGALCERLAATHDGDALRFYAARVASARATWTRIGGDLLGAWRQLHDDGAIELSTTAVTHAYLPGLSVLPQAVAAQLSLGRLAFERTLGVAPCGRWLPECGIDDVVDETLARQDVSHTFVDEHAARFAHPRIATPVFYSPRGVGYLSRDREASHRVWSRERGYPRHDSYREFYQDVGHSGVDVRPFEPGSMTGVKLQRIGGGPYDPEAAARRARHDAADFAAWLGGRDVVIAAYDAELFGHWWLEGPTFLSALGDALGGALVPASRLLDRSWPVAAPAASSWGRGGHAAPWMAHPEVWRLLHETHRAVTSRHASDAALRELLLMQASDWLFMLDGPLSAYARRRLTRHAQNAIDQRSDTSAFLPQLTPDDLAAALPSSVDGIVSATTLRRR